VNIIKAHTCKSRFIFGQKIGYVYENYFIKNDITRKCFSIQPRGSTMYYIVKILLVDYVGQSLPSYA
jgi:hypothetical protein